MLYLRWILRALLWGMLIAVVSNACTTINILNSRLEELYYVDSRLTSYVDLFVMEGKMRNVDVDVKELTMLFSKTGTKDDPNVVGTCQFFKGKPLVLIDKQYFNTSNEYDREELVFHELGHCLLGRDHCEAKDSNGRSVSIMEPTMVGSARYSSDRENMLNELFKPNSGCSNASKLSDGVNSSIHEWKDLE